MATPEGGPVFLGCDAGGSDTVTGISDLWDQKGEMMVLQALPHGPWSASSRPMSTNAPGKWRPGLRSVTPDHKRGTS